jgi:hypothetical protein
VGAQDGLFVVQGGFFGGGSFGTDLYRSTATIDASKITTANGGAGGQGGQGFQARSEAGSVVARTRARDT